MPESEPLHSQFLLKEIKGKRIFVVDDHHKALAAWVLVRREVDAPPVLISLDHHTDTMDAFLRASAGPPMYVSDETVRQQLLADFHWEDDASVLRAIDKLHHDEHIDAAARRGVLRAAFCINLSNRDGWPTSIEETQYREHCQARWPQPPNLPAPVRPFHYAPPEDQVFCVPFHCYVGCQQMPHDDDCLLRQASEVLESHYLDDQLARAAEMGCGIGLDTPESAPYVLDIDLDVFHTRQAIQPANATTFHRLIRGALAITIATEANCVQEEWLDDGGEYSAAQLLDRTCQHIELALE